MIRAQIEWKFRIAPEGNKTSIEHPDAERAYMEVVPMGESVHTILEIGDRLYPFWMSNVGRLEVWAE